jgi:hypothetical protein
MKTLGHILLFCVLLSVLKAIMIVIAIGIVLLLIWGLLFRTPQTVGLVALSLLIEGLQTHAIVTIGLIALSICIVLSTRIAPEETPKTKPANVRLRSQSADAGPGGRTIR